MPLQIIRQDITKMRVDAIVNPTNPELTGYSGIDFAVHQAAGPELERECRALGALRVGDAVITGGYRLPAKYIIHTTGPIWRGGGYGEDRCLRSCYENALCLAERNGCETVAFPLISSGNYGYPKDRVLRFAVEVITEYLKMREMTVFLCVWDRTSYEFSRTLYAEICAFLKEGEPDFCEASEARAVPKRQANFLRDAHPAAAFLSNLSNPEKSVSLEEYLKKQDKSFAEKLFDWIDARGMTDIACYKKANVDKKTFSKIRSNPKTYRPSKPTAVAFALALELSPAETQELLGSAGYALSRSFVFDSVILFFLERKQYDISEINQALFAFDQPCLGVSL